MERSLSAEVALNRAMAELDRLGLTTEVDPRVPAVRLWRAGQLVATGYGKGDGAQRLASAHFEALEVFFMSWRGNRRYAAGACVMMTASAIASQPALAPDLVIQRWAADFPVCRAACASFDGAGGSVWYPLFLCDPGYHHDPLPGDTTSDWQSFLRYSCSIGTAAGATVPEAALHAVGELIEHDGLSEAMLRWFFADDSRLRLVARNALPAHLQLLHERAGRAVDGEVLLLDVSTDFGVPVYLALKKGSGAEPAVFGAGASLSGEYAAERALHELIQMSSADGDEGWAAWSRLSPWPRLQRCLTLPVAPFLAGAELVPLRDSPFRSEGVEALLTRLIKLLGEHGTDVFLHELTPPDSQIAVVTAMAPGLERFSLVHMGIPIVPTGRGWGLWNTLRKDQ